MKHTALCLIPVLLAACATDEVVLRPLPAAQEPSSEAVFIRPRATVQAEFPFYIVVDGQPVFDLRSGENTRFRVSSGRQPLSIRCLGGPASKPLEARIEHDFAPRGTSYFIVEPKFDCASVRTTDAQGAALNLATTRFRALGVVNPVAQSTGDAPAVFSSQPAPRPSAAASPQEQVAAATAAWIDAFNKRDAARIRELYDPEAVLWGTSAQRIVAGAAAIAEYFKTLDAPSRSPVTAAIGEQRIRVYGDTAVDTGSYTFWVTRDGKQEPVPARYSIVYRNREGKWLIVDHHSSRVPAPN